MKIARLIFMALVFFASLAASRAQIGATIHYQLPTDGPLPHTYLVTLAVTDPQDPGWIVSNFAAGVLRTVTAENQGHFTETWNGLDENLMPVPPGRYNVKGIFMPAQKWAIDGQYHSVIPKLVAMGGTWGQSPGEDVLPGRVEGDPVNSPLRDVDVAPDGMGVVTFEYLENGQNYFLTDFNKPPGYGQIVAGYESGNFAGAQSTCSDGVDSWSFSDDGGQRFIGRGNGKPFGHQHTNRDNVYVPEGFVTALAAWPEKGAGRTVVFTAERGKLATERGDPVENIDLPVNRVRALDGRDATELAQWKINQPIGLAARNGRLYILHGHGDRFEVLTISLGDGWRNASPELLFKVPDNVHPFDIEADRHGRVYLSDSAANHVYQFDAQGKLLRTYGRLAEQPQGHYDVQTFMAPEKLACWTDSQGQDRLLVVEMGGPNRLSEWSGDTGALLHQWITPQTKANDGYAIDPRHSDTVYLPGQRDSLVRWHVDYATGKWTPEAVWTQIVHSTLGDNHLYQPLGRPRIIYHGNDAYLVFCRGYTVYKIEGDRLRACAAILVDHSVPDNPPMYLWTDRDGDGRVQPGECRDFNSPPGTLRYFGETWFDDLSLVGMGQDTTDIWRLAPESFDERGTPVFDRHWRKLLSDGVFAARASGRATALHGGNEVAVKFNSDWSSVAPGEGGDIYVSARSGPDFSANLGAQYKLSRYSPDSDGKLRQSWRVGRVALVGTAQPGQVYGPIFMSPPINGIVSVIDNSRAGVVLYTTDGLYVDTLFPDDHLISHDQMGAYWQPGEFFAGDVYANRENGKIYAAMGKTMPQIFETKGWTTSVNPARPIQNIDATVTLEAGEIAPPSPIALQIRGGASAARVAQFTPATGGAPALDGSMRGWESCDPVRFDNGHAQSVEVRCLYDRDHLYLRWHARTGHGVDVPPLGLPENLFAHDHEADTLGLYLQGDPQAQPGASSPGGRSGDVRFIFALVKNEGATQPVALGMYPTWAGANANSHSYHTPAGGTVSFAHVGLVPSLKSGYAIDSDGEGFTLAVALPREALPGGQNLDGWRTEGNFDANFGGHDRFWWSNADGSASRETQDEPTEARFYPGAWSPVQFTAMNALPIQSWLAIGPFGVPDIAHLDYDSDRDHIVKLLFGAKFPPDTERDPGAHYDGSITRTRKGEHRVTWKKADIGGETVDIGKVLDWNAYQDEGSAYLLTHIYSPAAADVTLQVTHPEGQYAIHGQLNGHALPIATDPSGPWTQIDPAQSLHLQAGWNELLIRRDFIWGDMTLGASLKGDPSVLWHLRISGAR